MSSLLTHAESEAIRARVAALEARTGIEIVAAVVARSNAYPQIPWKAFALGAAVAGAVVVIVDALAPAWPSAFAALAHSVAILGAGAACALLTIFVPPFARLFLRRARGELEVRRHAESLFVRHGLAATPARTGVLLLASVFERRIQLMPDVGFGERIDATEWHRIVAHMRPKLRGGRPADALLEGLAALEALLVAKGFGPRGDDANVLPDRPIVERRP